MAKGPRKKFIALALLLFLLLGAVPVQAEGDYAGELAAKGFPESYHAALTALHERYPQWVFEAFTPPVNWVETLRRETVLGVSLVQGDSPSSWKSTQEGAYNWVSSTWVELDSGGWVAASEGIVAHYLDPRNFLDSESVFQFLHQGCQTHNHNQIYQRNHHQGIECIVGLVAHQITRPGQISHRHITGNRGFLQQSNKFIADGGKHIAYRLGQHHMAHGFQPGQAKASSRLRLTLIHRIDAAADQLGHISTGVDAEGDGGHQHTVGAGAQDQKIKNQQQYRHGDSPDGCHINIANLCKGFENPIIFGQILHRGDHNTDGNTNEQRANGDHNGVPQTLQHDFIITAGNKGLVELRHPFE